MWVKAGLSWYENDLHRAKFVIYFLKICLELVDTVSVYFKVGLDKQAVVDKQLTNCLNRLLYLKNISLRIF